MRPAVTGEGQERPMASPSREGDAGLSSRERVYRAIRRQPTDKVPSRMSHTNEIMEALQERLGADTPGRVFRRLGVDFREIQRMLAPDFLELEASRWVHALSDEGYRTARHAYTPLASVETMADLEAYDWNDLDGADEAVYATLANQVAEWNRDGDEHFIMYKAGCLFTTLCEARGYERFLTDPILNPELARAMLDALTGRIVRDIERAGAEAPGLIDTFNLSDDLGTQRALMVSPRLCRDFFFPCYERIFDAMKRQGALVFFHSCGAIAPIIPDLIALGVDILHPLQTLAAGMDYAALKARYGERLCFCGGIDVQRLLPYATPAEVKDEVRRVAGVLGAGGGYILDACNKIQPDTPVENVLAMYEATMEMGLG